MYTLFKKTVVYSGLNRPRNHETGNIQEIRIFRNHTIVVISLTVQNNYNQGLQER